MNAQQILDEIERLLKRRGPSWRQNAVVFDDAEIIRLLAILSMHIGNGAKVYISQEIKDYQAFVANFMKQFIQGSVTTPPIVPLLDIWFSLEELHTLAFTLGIDYQQFPHDNKPAFIHRFVIAVQAQGKLNMLKQSVATARPHIAHLL